MKVSVRLAESWLKLAEKYCSDWIVVKEKHRSNLKKAEQIEYEISRTATTTTTKETKIDLKRRKPTVPSKILYHFIFVSSRTATSRLLSAHTHLDPSSRRRTSHHRRNTRAPPLHMREWRRRASSAMTGRIPGPGASQCGQQEFVPNRSCEKWS